MGGGGSYGQLAKSRSRACQAAYSNSGPQGPAGRQARARGGGSRSLAWAGGGGSSRTGHGPLAVRSAADLGNLSHFSWQAGTEHPAPGTHCPLTATGKLPGTAALYAWLGGVSAPFSVWGQHTLPGSQGVSLSLGQALAGRLTARTGQLPTATTASWIASSGSTMTPSLPGPTSCWEQGLHVCVPFDPHPVGLGATGRQMLPRFPLPPLLSPPSLFPPSLLSS